MSTLTPLTTRLDFSAFRFESPAHAWRAQGEDQRSAREEEQRPRLPEAAVLRRIIKARQARMRHFDADLFADPAFRAHLISGNAIFSLSETERADLIAFLRTIDDETTVVPLTAGHQLCPTAVEPETP